MKNIRITITLHLKNNTKNNITKTHNKKDNI